MAAAGDVTTQTYPIVEKRLLAPKVTRYVVRAPDVAQARRPGQFVIVRPRNDSERIPLTIADGTSEAIVLVVQEVGKTTAVMADMAEGESLADVCGPLGRPTRIEHVGTVVVAGGGIGVAPAHPIAQALKAEGNHVIAIVAARTRELIILEDEMRRASHELVVTTDDGSYGRHGLVTAALEAVLEGGRSIDQVVAIGPPIMMKRMCEVTRPHKIPTIVSLNTIMVDGTGMCGGCRVSVGGATRFVCVDGPEFDGHQVDFDLLMRRLAMYKDQESQAYERYLRDHACQLGATGALPSQPTLGQEAAR
jgi:NAD(P)H-flavin reductase